MCSIENCQNKILARGFCKKHYEQQKRLGKLQNIQHHNKTRLQCSVENCNKLSIAKCLCVKHYKRLKKHGWTSRPIDKTLWTEANIAWIAGIIEGEGNFNLRKSKRSLRIRIRMTDLDVLEKCLHIIKCGKIYGPYHHKKENCKDYWDWTISRNDEITELIKVIKPWLCSRRSNKLNEIYSEWLYANS